MEGLPKNVGLFALIVKKKLNYFFEKGLESFFFQKFGRRESQGQS